MCRRCRAKFVILSAVFGIGKFAQRLKKLVACESFGDELPFVIIFSELALANTSSCRSSWLFVSIAFERILILDFSPTAIAPDNAKSMGFCENVYPRLKTGDIGGGLAGNGGIRNFRRGT
jgi:hypothetical protein